MPSESDRPHCSLPRDSFGPARSAPDMIMAAKPAMRTQPRTHKEANVCDQRRSLQSLIQALRLFLLHICFAAFDPLHLSEAPNHCSLLLEPLDQLKWRLCNWQTRTFPFQDAVQLSLFTLLTPVPGPTVCIKPTEHRLGS
jgi:hypothetical protein